MESLQSSVLQTCPASASPYCPWTHACHTHTYAEWKEDTQSQVETDRLSCLKSALLSMSWLGLWHTLLSWPRPPASTSQTASQPPSTTPQLSSESLLFYPAPHPRTKNNIFYKEKQAFCVIMVKLFSMGIFIYVLYLGKIKRSYLPYLQKQV